jgi:Protein of unknown function (DUF3224)
MPTPDGTEAVVATHAMGSFNVQMTPQASDDKAGGTSLGHLALRKQYHGDLEADSTGEMLSAMTSVKGSAGYVAIERVTGVLGGKTGSFVLLHRGIMTDGTQEQSITVVPHSGDGELAGMRGQLAMTVVDGKHSYDLEYTLPDA